MRKEQHRWVVGDVVSLSFLVSYGVATKTGKVIARVDDRRVEISFDDGTTGVQYDSALYQE
jgi:sporulation protein YlmC with PRC-barrel domain